MAASSEARNSARRMTDRLVGSIMRLVRCQRAFDRFSSRPVPGRWPMPSIRCRRVALALLPFLLAVAALAPPTDAAETPRSGGTLLAVIGADPPSLDPHQESTFATIQLV